VQTVFLALKEGKRSATGTSPDGGMRRTHEHGMWVT